MISMKAIRRLLLTLVIAASLQLANRPAVAQIAAVVNGDVITTHDVAQRTRLIAVSTRTNPARKDVLDELINDKLKLSVAKRYKIDIPDREVDASFEQMAKRMGLTGQGFTQVLDQAGIGAPILKSRIKADISWQQIIRGKFREALQVGEGDLKAALPAAAKETTVTQYTLRPILLVVPRGTPASSRQQEADGLRTRFTDCTEGLKMAKGVRDVAIRETITKTSNEFPPALKEILDNTAVGKLTKPEATANGMELFAVCEKKQVTGDSPDKIQAREKISSERFQTQSKRYLEELKRGAMIELR